MTDSQSNAPAKARAEQLHPGSPVQKWLYLIAGAALLAAGAIVSAAPALGWLSIVLACLSCVGLGGPLVIQAVRDRTRVLRRWDNLLMLAAAIALLALGKFLQAAAVLLIYDCSLAAEKLLLERTLGRQTELTVLGTIEPGRCGTRWIDWWLRWAPAFTILLACTAVVLAITAPLVLHHTFATWIRRALALVIAACSQRLLFSLLLGAYMGLWTAAGRDIAVRDARSLDLLAQARTVVWDKTGVVTDGNFQVERVQPVEGWAPEQLLALAATLERASDHSLARAVVAAAGTVPEVAVEQVAEVPGQGIAGNVSGTHVMVGTDSFLRQMGGVPVLEVREDEEPGTILHVAVDSGYVGYIVMADRIRSEAGEAVQALRELGMRRVALLSGDRKSVVERIGRELGADEIYYEKLPEQRLAELKAIQNEENGAPVVYVGDGVGDIPLLEAADVGVSIGAVTVKADVVSFANDPGQLVEARRIAKGTRRLLLANALAAVAVKAAAVGLCLFGLIEPWTAALADGLITVACVASSLQMLWMKGWKRAGV